MTRVQFVETYKDTLLRNYNTAQLTVCIDLSEMYNEKKPRTNGELGFEYPYLEAFYQGFLAGLRTH